MNEQLEYKALINIFASGKIKKSELLRMLRLLDPRYYSNGIPDGSRRIRATGCERMSYNTRQARNTRDLLRRHFAVHFAQSPGKAVLEGV